MIRINTILLTVALGLITSALAGTPAAPIQITALPFTIAKPGTYVLVSDLNYTGATAAQGHAIDILANLPGPVVLNLKGHTITGSIKAPFTDNGSVGVFISGGPSLSTITVENGTITHFDIGVFAVGGPLPLSGIDINNITFSYALSIGTGYDVNFAGVISSTIRNCTFTTSDIGIAAGSAGGNRFTKNTFINMQNACLLLAGGGTANIPTVLDDCRFDAPAN